MTQPENPFVYHAYLLRIWRENGPEGKWRFSLEEVFGERTRRGFDDLDVLFKFLQDQIRRIIMSKKYKVLIWIVLVANLVLTTQTVFAGDCPPSKMMPPPPSPPSPPAAPVAPDEPEDEPNQNPPKEKEFEVSEGQKADFNLGNSGVYLPSAAPGVKVFIHKMPLATLKQEVHYFLHDAVKVEMFDQDGNTLQKGNAYIYFNLDKGDLAAWKEGKLAVFKYDPEKHSFSRQNSYSVDAGKHGRVAALVSEPGIYVLRKEISLPTEVLQAHLTGSSGE